MQGPQKSITIYKRALQVFVWIMVTSTPSQEPWMMYNVLILMPSIQRENTPQQKTKAWRATRAASSRQATAVT